MNKKDVEMSKFEIILWDVDQTLLDFELSQAYALGESFQKFGLEMKEEVLSRYAEINTAYWKRHELGEVSKEELLTGRFETLFLELGVENIDIGAFAAVYQKALGSVYYFRDDSFTLCSKLKGKVRQYAVTNGVTATQRNKLHLSGLDKILDDIFISEEIGYPKPQREYFERCFQRIPGFQKDKALIVGDSLTSDIRGGNQVGIPCCWYNPEGKENHSGLQVDYEIKNLWELEDII